MIECYNIPIYSTPDPRFLYASLHQLNIRCFRAVVDLGWFLGFHGTPFLKPEALI